MNKECLIQQARQDISELIKSVRNIRALDTGYLYEFTVNGYSILARVRAFNTLSVNMEIFACSHSQYNYGRLSINFTGFNDLKKVDPADLPLYIGWTWHSDSFEKLLKGKLRLKKG
jgi:hypothetical protein